MDTPIYIGSSYVPSSVESSKNYFYNKATINFSEINTSEINIRLEQSACTDVTIQHMYWQPSSNSESLRVLDNSSRFDPASLTSLGFADVQYSFNDLVPNSLRPNIMKENFSLATKKIDITYKQPLKAEHYLISFKRLNTANPAVVQKHYYLNPNIAFETLAVQQEMAATLDIDSGFYYESLERCGNCKKIY
ncbi:hypothetical protein [Flavobacterium sp.]|uniref:hypothetical protein n=1 Tax=Flavobacterium sp. TaxID=239 RepID=UPI003BCE29DB